MPRFRKKPIEIEAHQWFKNGDHPEDNPSGEAYMDGEVEREPEGKVVRYYRNPEDDEKRECEQCGYTMNEHGWIDTLEGNHIVCPGDFVITGVAGEKYPCKPAIFALTYDSVEEKLADEEPGTKSTDEY